MIDRIRSAAEFIRQRTSSTPAVGLILGSGLGGIVDGLEIETAIPFDEIPGAPKSTVAGHSGRLVIGQAGGVTVAAMQGRVHYYEGWSIEEVILLPRVLAVLGAKKVIITNAAGGVNADYRAGDLMLISDHINMFAEHPLRGANVDELGPRFPDMTDAYSTTLRTKTREVAQRQRLELREGVYLGLSGPSYETPAEIRAWRSLGADAVGMSTIPEVIALRHMEVEILGISCITNMAAGILPRKLDHAEVMETTARVQREFTELVLGVIPGIAE